MDQQFQGKSIPWLQLKNYFENHERIINFDKMMKTGDMTIADVEARLPRPLFQIYEEVARLLKEHNVLKEPEDNRLSQL
jgi:hypothetical protein